MSIFSKSLLDVSRESSTKDQKRAMKSLKKKLDKKGYLADDTKMFTSGFRTANIYLHLAVYILIWALAMGVLGVANGDEDWLYIGIGFGIIAIAFFIGYLCTCGGMKVIAYWDQSIVVANQFGGFSKIIDFNKAGKEKTTKGITIEYQGKNYKIKSGKENGYKYYSFLEYFNIAE